MIDPNNWNAGVIRWGAAGVVALALIGLLIAVNQGDDPVPNVSSTTTSTTAPVASNTTVTGLPSSTTSNITTVPSTTTTTIVGTTFDVIVVGDSLGGVSAAISAAREGASVALLSYATFPGGQASASGVASFDEGGQTARRGGIYQELLGQIQSVYGQVNVGGCYFLNTTVCPDPRTVYLLLYRMLDRSGVVLVSLSDAPDQAINQVLSTGSTVTGIVADGVRYESKVLIDATEFQDLYPLIAGLDYQVGSGLNGCVQHVTWPVVVSWYPGGAPSEVNPPGGAIDDLRAIYGGQVDDWLDHFRSLVANPPEGMAVWPGWDNWDGITKWSPAVERRYRAIADQRLELTSRPSAPAVTLTALNYANDSPLTAQAVEDPQERRSELVRALHVTYAYLWYLYWELGQVDWGVATHLHFEDSVRSLSDEQVGPDVIPDSLEQYFPPAPYVREGRRLSAVYTLTGADLAVRGPQPDRFGDSVMLGQYFTDAHACDLEQSLRSSDGPYEVPLRSFIPVEIDGFLPGLGRAAGVDRAAASSLRVHPEEISAGQVVGTVAGLAVAGGVQPREVSAEEVRRAIRFSGMPVDIAEATS